MSTKKSPTKTKTGKIKVKGQKLSGHARLKQALVLRDALLHELGFNLKNITDQLRTVENNIGTQKALDEGKYLEAASSVCRNNKALLAEWDLLLRDACNRVDFTPRYAQYLALILFIHWWQMQQEDSEALLYRLNDWLKKHPPENETLPSFQKEDLQFAAFWMATAAGKTHILHACLALLMQNSGNRHQWDRIILITPGDGLTKQHAEKLRNLRQWDVFAYPHDGDQSALLRLKKDTVIILDINKLSEVKKGEGLSIPTSDFKEGRNLIFVDEGHKGQTSEQSLWKKLQQDLAGINAPQTNRRGLLIEFSATFGQVAEAEHAFDRYARSVLFDYAYDRFHADHYGKDFWHVRLDGRGGAEKAVQHHTLTAALLSFWHQWCCYHDRETKDLCSEKQLQIAVPLWVLLGLKVIGGKGQEDKDQTADVVDVLTFLHQHLSAPEALAQSIDDIIGIKKTGGDLLPFDVRKSLIGQSGKSLCNQLLADIFQWQNGDKPVFRLLKGADGELGLGLLRGDKVHYYGVVNVGDAKGLKDALSTATLAVDDDVLSPSLFAQLDDGQSGLNILIGSRRFAEGWDNYRACSLTLLRLGQGEGSLIIQMFGRVVRFAGVNGDGKRLVNPPDILKPLQTAYVYGLRSTYLDIFLKSLFSNGVMESIEITCKTKVNLPDNSPLISIKAVAPAKDDFKVHLTGQNWLKTLNTVKLSLAGSVSTSELGTSGVKGEKGLLGQDLTERFQSLIPLIDQIALYHEMANLKRQLRWWNFSFDLDAIDAALNNGKYEIFGLPNALIIQSEQDLARVQRMANTLVRKLFEAAYRKQENRHSRFEFIPALSSGIPENYRKESH